MAVVLGHISAMEYWLAHPRRKPDARRCGMSAPPSTGPRKSELASLAETLPGVLSSPIHVLTSAQVKAEKSKPVVPHLIGSSLSSRSIYRIGADHYTASVELGFLQMARTLEFRDLIRLGFELCGSYSLCEEASRGFFARLPLTSVRKLGSFVDEMAGTHGSKSARRALRYILPGSASPAETKLAMALCLPPSLGGFGLPRPTLNQRIDLSPSEQRMSGRGFLRCDLYWPDAHLGIEYDSDAEHTGSERIASDANRRNTLTLAGETIVVVTRMQYNSLSDLTCIANAVARQLGARIQPRCRDFSLRQRELRDLLYRQPEWEQQRRVRPLERDLRPLLKGKSAR